MVLISLPNATIFFTYIQTVKMQDETRAREKERGERLVHFPPFSKCQINCFQPVLQANAPLSSINKGKYVTMAARRKKWLIPQQQTKKSSLLLCIQCIVSRVQRGEKSLHLYPFLLVKHYFRKCQKPRKFHTNQGNTSKDANIFVSLSTCGLFYMCVI